MRSRCTSASPMCSEREIKEVRVCRDLSEALEAAGLSD
jgi:hypothetical protein